MPRPTITLIGPGALGSALARALHAGGYRIDEIVARPKSLRGARTLAREVASAATTLADARLQSDILWLCVPDDAIATCARGLAARGALRGKIALHSSGALGSDLLDPLRRRGAAVASLHPMQSFVRTSSGDLRGIWFGVEGDARAVRLARRIAADLGGHVLPVAARNKALYHALGSFSSPMLVAVLALAERVAGEAGIPPRARRGLMEPIVRRTLENYFAHGAGAAFSGPLKRGDVTTIRAHLEALRRVPRALDAYRALVRSALDTLPVGHAAEIRALLGAAVSPSSLQRTAPKKRRVR